MGMEGLGEMEGGLGEGRDVARRRREGNILRKGGKGGLEGKDWGDGRRWDGLRFGGEMSGKFCAEVKSLRLGHMTGKQERGRTNIRLDTWIQKEFAGVEYKERIIHHSSSIISS